MIAGSESMSLVKWCPTKHQYNYVILCSGKKPNEKNANILFTGLPEHQNSGNKCRRAYNNLAIDAHQDTITLQQLTLNCN